MPPVYSTPAVLSYFRHGSGCAHHHTDAHAAVLASGARGVVLFAHAVSASPHTKARCGLPPGKALAQPLAPTSQYATLRYVLALPWHRPRPCTLYRYHMLVGSLINQKTKCFEAARAGVLACS